jgi:hypothetical protein
MHCQLDLARLISIYTWLAYILNIFCRVHWKTLRPFQLSTRSLLLKLNPLIPRFVYRKCAAIHVIVYSLCNMFKMFFSNIRTISSAKLDICYCSSPVFHNIWYWKVCMPRRFHAFNSKLVFYHTLWFIMLRCFVISILPLNTS